VTQDGDFERGGTRGHDVVAPVMPAAALGVFAQERLWPVVEAPAGPPGAGWGV